MANGPDTCVTIPTSMRDPARPERLRVYPNPAEEEITLDRSGPLYGPAHVRVFDMLGRCVLEERDRVWPNGRLTLDIGSLLPGVYVGMINATSTSRFSFVKR